LNKGTRCSCKGFQAPPPCLLGLNTPQVNQRWARGPSWAGSTCGSVGPPFAFLETCFHHHHTRGSSSRLLFVGGSRGRLPCLEKRPQNEERPLLPSLLLSRCCCAPLLGGVANLARSVPWLAEKWRPSPRRPGVGAAGSCSECKGRARKYGCLAQDEPFKRGNLRPLLPSDNKCQSAFGNAVVLLSSLHLVSLLDQLSSL